MKTQRNRYSADFKARLALEVVKGQRTLNEIASEHGVHPNLLLQWKKHLLEELPALFADKRCKQQRQEEEHEAQLYHQIGQLKVELDWLKNKLACLGRSADGAVSAAEKRSLVTANAQISLARQCALLGLSRSGFYYRPVHSCGETELNLHLMRLIDEQYTRTPFFGYRKMAVNLRERGYPVNKKRIQRLMQLLGLEAILPKPNLSKPHPEYTVDPYLPRGVTVDRVNHVWGADIS